MKIDPTGKPMQIITPDPAHVRNGTDEKSDFSKVLDDTMHHKKAGSAQKVHLANPAAGAAMRTHNDLHTSGWRAADGLLDALEAYRNQLANPEADLKMVEPCVDRMNDLCDKAQPLLARLSEENPVKSVIQETMVHISKEIERFNMGYYVDG